MGFGIRRMSEMPSRNGLRRPKDGQKHEILSKENSTQRTRLHQPPNSLITIVRGGCNTPMNSLITIVRGGCNTPMNSLITIVRGGCNTPMNSLITIVRGGCNTPMTIVIKYSNTCSSLE